MERVLAGGPAASWLETLSAAGVPCGPISTVAEALSSEQAKARQLVVDAGGLPVPGNPVKLSAFPDPGSRPAAPALNADGARIRDEFS